MAHPYRSQASESSRTKTRAIAGKGGGGSPHAGGSSFKRAAKTSGEMENYQSHPKKFSAGFAHGGAVKARGDRRARGGMISGAKRSPKGKGKHRGDVNIAIVQPHPQAPPNPLAGLGGPPPGGAPMGAGAGGPRPPVPPP